MSGFFFYICDEPKSGLVRDLGDCCNSGMSFLTLLAITELGILLMLSKEKS